MSVAIVGSAYVDIHAITDKVEKQISRAFEKIKDVTVNVGADISAALSETEAVAEAIDNLNTDINVDVNTDSVNEAVQNIESQSASIPVEADTQQARNDIDDLISDESGQSIPISVNPVTAYAAARFSWLARTRVVDFVAQVNKTAFAKTAAALASLSGGKDLLDKMQRLSNYLLDIGAHAPKIATVSVAIAGITGAVAAAVSNVLVLAGSLAQIGMAGLALPGILLGFATGLGTMIVALKEAKTYLGDLKYLFTETKNTITANFWEPATQPIREMVSTIMPAFNAAIGTVASSLGGFAAATASAMQEWITAGHLQYVMKNLSESIDIAAGGMNPLIESIVTLGQVGSEYLPALAEWFTRISERFNNWIQGADSDGRLHEWINTGIAAMYDLGKVVAETVRIFHGLYTAAEAAGGSTLATLGDALERIANIVETPAFQSTLISVFRGGHAAMDGMLSALGPLGDAFYVLKDAIETSLGYAGETIGAMGTNLATMIGQASFGEGLVAMFSGIRSGAEALAPAMAPLGVALGALGGVIGALAANSGPLLAAVLGAVAGPATTLFNAVQPLIPILGEALIGIITALAPAMQTFADAIAGALPGIVSFISFMAELVTQIINGLGPALPAIVLGIMGLVTAVKLIGTAASGITAAKNGITAVKDAAEAAKKGVSAIASGAATVGSAVASGLSSGIAAIKSMTAAVAASAAGQKIAAAATAVWSGIQGAFNAVMALNPIMLIVIAIAALIAGVVLAYNKIGWFKDFVNGAFELIKAGVQILVDFWNNTLVPMFDAAMEKARPFFDGIVNLLTTIGDGAIAAFDGIVGFVTGVVQGISDVITNVVTSISTWWNSTWTAISDTFKAAWDGIVWFFEPLVNLIIAVVRFFVDTFMAIWNGVWPIIFAVFEGIWLKITEFFTPIIQGIVDTFHAVIDGVVTWWTGVWQGISDFFTTIWNNIVAWITPILTNIVLGFHTVIDGVVAWWTSVWQSISDFFTTIWNNIVAFISPIISAVGTVISAGITHVQSVWSSVWGAISSFFSGIWNAITSAVSSAINTVQSVISGVMNGISSLWNSTWSAISGFVSSTWNGIVSAVSGFVQSVKDKVTDVLSAMGRIGSDIMAKVSDFPTKLISAGRDLINGLAQGIDNARHVVVDKIKEIASAALDSVKSFFGIKSPSRVMRDQVGLQIGYGLAIGIEKSMSRVEKASAALSDAAMVDTPDISLPSVSGGSSFNVPRAVPSGSSGSTFGPAGGGTAGLGAGTVVNFQVNPSAGLNEEQIGESAMEHMFWKLQTQP